MSAVSEGRLICLQSLLFLDGSSGLLSTSVESALPRLPQSFSPRVLLGLVWYPLRLAEEAMQRTRRSLASTGREREILHGLCSRPAIVAASRVGLGGENRLRREKSPRNKSS